VTNPHITFWQYVKQEPSDKFICLDCHGFLTITVNIISPEERNVAIPIGEDTIIADRDPVSISAEVLKDTLGTIERRFAVNDPLLMIELFPEGFEVSGLLEMADSSEEYKVTRFEVVFEKVKELAAKQGRHDLYRDEEAFAA